MLAGLLADGAPVVLDGGLATELEARGHDLSDDLWSARLLRDDPAAIEDVHLAYLRAGARVLITASYQASRAGFQRTGMGAAEADEVLRESVRIAVRARDRFFAEKPDAPRPLVAASVGPYGATLADGQEYTGDYGGLTAGALERFHAERMAVLLAAGPDCVACETIPRADEGEILARVLDRLAAPAAWISFSARDGRSTCHGEPIEHAVAGATTSARVLAVGINCTAPEHVGELLQRAATVTDRPLVAYPNSGRMWDGTERRWRAGPGVDQFPPALVRGWLGAGARLVGGCCGIGPDAIRDLARVTTKAPSRTVERTQRRLPMDPAQLKDVPLFSALDRRGLEAVARHADEVDVKAGARLTEQGRLAYEFFVIKQGTATVSREGEHVATLGPGDYFGEIGAIEGERRTADVVADADMRLVVMHARDFRALVRSSPEVAEQVRAAIAERSTR